MKKYLFLATLLLALLYYSCIPSLHPLYSEDTIVYNESIIGAWRDDDGQLWEFGKLSDNSYKLILSEDEKKDVLEVHLVKLEDNYFFDFYSLYLKDEDHLAFFAPPIPSHGFAKVKLEEEQMQIQFFNYDWLDKLFEQRRIRLKHERLQDGEIVLTAPTSELQKFVVKYADEEEAFERPEILKKIK